MIENNLVKIDVLAKAFHRTDRRIRQLVKENILPRAAKKGLYDYWDSHHAFVKYLDKLISGSGKLSLTEERTRLTKAQADKVEYEIKILHREYVKGAEVKDTAFNTARKVRDALLNIPDRTSAIYASEKDEHKIHTMQMKEITQVLKELSDA